MLAYLSNRNKNGAASHAQEVPSISSPKAQVSISGSDEIIEMDRMRKMISQRMIDSKRISAHRDFICRSRHDQYCSLEK